MAPSRRIAPRETFSGNSIAATVFRARDFLLGRREDRVAGVDLRRMNQRLAVKTEIAAERRR